MSEIVPCPHCGQPVTIPTTASSAGRRGGAKSRGGGRPRLYKTEAERKKARARTKKKDKTRWRLHQKLDRLADMKHHTEEKKNDQ